MNENEQQLIELIRNAKNSAALYAVADVAISACLMRPASHPEHTFAPPATTFENAQ